MSPRSVLRGNWFDVKLIEKSLICPYLFGTTSLIIIYALCAPVFHKYGRRTQERAWWLVTYNMKLRRDWKTCDFVDDVKILDATWTGSRLIEETNTLKLQVGKAATIETQS